VSHDGLCWKLKDMQWKWGVVKQDNQSSDIGRDRLTRSLGGDHALKFRLKVSVPAVKVVQVACLSSESEPVRNFLNSRISFTEAY
jgi:hypothetical protein